MGAGASVPDEIPESEEAALAAGYTAEQIEEYKKGHAQAQRGYEATYEAKHKEERRLRKKQ